MRIADLSGDEHTDTTVTALLPCAKSFLREQLQQAVASAHRDDCAIQEREFRERLAEEETRALQQGSTTSLLDRGIQISDINGEVESALALARLEGVIMEWHQEVAWYPDNPLLDEHVATLLGLTEAQLARLWASINWILNKRILRY